MWLVSVKKVDVATIWIGKPWEPPYISIFFLKMHISKKKQFLKSVFCFKRLFRPYVVDLSQESWCDYHLNGQTTGATLNDLKYLKEFSRTHNTVKPRSYKSIKWLSIMQCLFKKKKTENIWRSFSASNNTPNSSQHTLHVLYIVGGMDSSNRIGLTSPSTRTTQVLQRF